MKISFLILVAFATNLSFANTNCDIKAKNAIKSVASINGQGRNASLSVTVVDEFNGKIKYFASSSDGIRKISQIYTILANKESCIIENINLAKTFDYNF